SVGNLPRVNNMDIQYSQSAVFTPSDFAFPNDAIKAEAAPITEMVLIADVDAYALRDLHQYGTVKNLKDRRTSVYKVELIKKNIMQEKVSTIVMYIFLVVISSGEMVFDQQTNGP